MSIRISELTDAAALSGDELLELSRPSPTVTMTATTISAAATDDSLNDSAAGFVAADFAVGDSVRVQGFADGTNNVFSARIAALTASKMELAGVSLANESAGASIIITKWESVQSPINGLVNSSLSVQTVISSATVTPLSTNDLVEITAQAAALTVANPSGSPANGWGLTIRVKDNGTARAITWGSDYRAIGVTLPNTTVAGKQHYVGAIYNSTASKWDVVSVGAQA